MKVIIAFALALAACGFQSSDDNEVFICVSKSAEVYHLNKSCHGLGRCTHEVKKVTLTEAKNQYKRRLCGYED